MKIRPTRGYVLIEPLEADEISAGGVILPDRVKDMPQKGKILVIGPIPLELMKIAMRLGERGISEDATRRMFQDSDFKVGDTVIFKRFVDNRIKEDGKELLLVKFEDILGVYG